jgi:hypothetical protein
MSVYSLKKFANLDHLHLFEGEITKTEPSIECTSINESCCGNIIKSEHEFVANEFVCEPERSTLIKCISTKSSICAACEAHVFKKYQDQNRHSLDSRDLE